MSTPDDTLESVHFVPSPPAQLSLEQRAQRYRDALSWVAENARCIETRRFVAKVFRELEVERAQKPR